MKTAPMEVHNLIQKELWGLKFDVSDIAYAEAGRGSWREYGWTEMRHLEIRQGLKITFQNNKDAEEQYYFNTPPENDFRM